MALGLILVAFLVIAIFIRFSKPTNTLGAKPLPGPKGLPYAGVPHRITPKRIWLKFEEWSKTYGPIYGLTIMGEYLVIVTSKKVSEELLLKRKSNYSSRPFFPAVPGANYDKRYLPLLSRGEDHSRIRRFAMYVLGQVPRSHLTLVAQRASIDYVHALLKNPSDAKSLTELCASRISSEIAWGDPSVARQNAETAWALMHQVSPGATIAGKLPFLSSLWDILPDMLQPWKTAELARSDREHRFWRSQQEKARDARNGQFTLMGEYYRQAGAGQVEEWEAANTIGMLTVIGSLLLSTPVQMYIIAMCHYPEWQKRGAEEMDRVCPGRLPVPSDLKDLPVLRAIIREVHRWRSPVPTGAPHVTEQDDVYDGYFIPKHSSVLSIAHTIERDPDLYPDPESFRPERWLEPEWPTYQEPLTEYPRLKNHIGFGWGPRMCIGQDYVEIVNMVMIGSLLASCTVQKKIDPATGRAIEIPTMDYEPTTLFVRPYKWEMDAVARSEDHLRCMEEQ